MYFSQAYKIKNPLEKDWFDISLSSDTKLFLDPMLIFQSDKAGFEKSTEKIKKFFTESFKRIAQVKGTPAINNPAILRLFEFKEPREMYLGFTEFGSDGSGIGKSFSIEIRNAISDLLDLGLEEFGAYVTPIEMFVKGIGQDRISDMISNLIREDLILYTQKICKENDISLQKVIINNIRFDEKLGWIHGKVELPINPLSKNPIILVPKDFLRTSFSLDRDDFYNYLLRIENIELRKQASTLFTDGLDINSLREAVRKEPTLTKDLIRDYIKFKESQKVEPYNFKDDPEIIGELLRRIEFLVKRIDSKVDIDSFNLDDLKKFVDRVIDEFKFQVESNEGYLTLFDDSGEPRGEKIAHTLFWNIASTMCRNSNKLVDINPESETGRGPVDFKFSRGYSKRVLVELKLAGSSALYHGLEKQLPTYLEVDEVDTGYYLVLKQLKNHGTKIAELNDRHSKLKINKGKQIILKVIDASKESKIPASRV